MTLLNNLFWATVHPVLKQNYFKEIYCKWITLHDKRWSIEVVAYLFTCSSQSSGGGGLSATVRANRTCRSHSFITLRALWLSYRRTGVGVTVSTSIKESESLQTKKKNTASLQVIKNVHQITNFTMAKEKQPNRSIFNSQNGFRLATWGNKQRPRGSSTAGIWVGIPWFGIAVVQKY